MPSLVSVLWCFGAFSSLWKSFHTLHTINTWNFRYFELPLCLGPLKGSFYHPFPVQRMEACRINSHINIGRLLCAWVLHRIEGSNVFVLLVLGVSSPSWWCRNVQLCCRINWSQAEPPAFMLPCLTLLCTSRYAKLLDKSRKSWCLWVFVTPVSIVLLQYSYSHCCPSLPPAFSSPQTANARRSCWQKKLKWN